MEPTHSHGPFSPAPAHRMKATATAEAPSSPGPSEGLVNGTEDLQVRLQDECHESSTLCSSATGIFDYFAKGSSHLCSTLDLGDFLLLPARQHFSH